MSEQLDNELRKRISEVFDNYEDTAPAEEGWLLLRQKFPEKKNNRIIPMWWMSAAAVLLLLAAFGLWLYNQPAKTGQDNNHAAIKSPKQLNQSGQQNEPVKPEPEIKINTLDKKYQSTLSQANIQNSSKLNGRFNGSISRENQTATKPVTTNSQENFLTSTINAQSPVNQQTQPGNVRIAANNGLPTNAVVSKIDTVNTATQNILAQQNPRTTQQQKSIIATQKDSASADAAQSRMAALLAKEQNKEEINAKKDKTENKLNADKRVLYGVYAATYFNYAEGSKTQMNTGAGFSTDIRLTKNIKLSTGIAIGRNTLSYENQPVTASIQSDAVAASNYARVEVLPAAANTQLGFNSLKVAATPSVSGYNVSLTGLDVPVNIKYEFSPQKTDAYISAGLSSGTFISESFNYRFTNNIPGAIATSNASLPDATSSKSFTGFNFARTLNLSMGVGYQLTKRNRLVIEPFFKYPLGGLGSQQIRFGSGGLNLQFKFQGSKK